MAPIIIVGSGLAGYTVARELRKLNREVPLTIISRDCGSFYSKPMLSNAFQQGKNAASLVNFTADQMAAQLNAEILREAEVEEISTHSHTVTVAGKRLPYSSLVLALGADQRQTNLSGDGAADVLTVNDLADYARFRQALVGCRRVAILGAGLIGCEFANDLASAQFDVTLIDPALWPLSRLVPEPAGQAMAAALSKVGVTLHLGKTPQSIERRGNAYRIHMESGETLEADRIVAAIGLTPRVALARKSGLFVERGIVTNAWLHTSANDVYALGDCAEVDGLVLPYVMPIMQAARALAKTLNGESTRVAYPAMPVVVKTPAMPTVAVPPLDANGRWESAKAFDDEADPNSVWSVFRNDQNEMCGFALMGDYVKEKNTLLSTMAPWLA
ncbi:FAD-dependent oxidoreductase [Collimonas silvisoli]|uniref:FAD-dependent oxidoreductase n=1 Tax=Collimonas silvisoli TaxID=2825884 RepID=UPI001B8C17B6|nr:FAD-dependent oxidoreductase [Collimonas silvisoli]